jgi:hypothetical protein
MSAEDTFTTIDSADSGIAYTTSGATVAFYNTTWFRLGCAAVVVGGLVWYARKNVSISWKKTDSAPAAPVAAPTHEDEQLQYQQHQLTEADQHDADNMV